MDDDIQLPPLPPFSMAPVADTVTVRDYARAAVLADRERRAKQEAKPVVQSKTKGVIITLGYTDDGKVWIESERNRRLAKMLRIIRSTPHDERTMRDSADALDGGERRVTTESAPS